MSLPSPKAPSSITPDVLRLCTKIKPGSRPLFVEIIPATGALPHECFPNVRNQIDRFGGRIQYGWAIWQCDNFFVEAEHHAVYDPKQDGSFVDITPQNPPIKKLLFLPDDSAIHDPNTTLRTDNHRMALFDDPRLHRILYLFTERTELLNMVPAIRGEVTLTGFNATYYAALENQIMELSEALMRDRINIWRI